MLGPRGVHSMQKQPSGLRHAKCHLPLATKKGGMWFLGWAKGKIEHLRNKKGGREKGRGNLGGGGRK